MLDIAWPELIVIGAVALVAIPPKDLPRVMHALGRAVGKIRAFGHELQRTFDQLSYESEIAEKLKKTAASVKEPPASAPAPPEKPPETSPEKPTEPQADHDHGRTS